MSVKEKVSAAQRSKNLQEVPYNQIGDIDVIRACGMVGVEMPLGLSLWRLKYSDAENEFVNVFNGLLTMVLSRYHNCNGYQVTQTVIKHWLDNVCKACSGRGKEVVPGTPMLSDRDCEVCHGQGRIAMHNPDDASRWLLAEIQRMEQDVSSAIAAKLNSRSPL